MNGPEKRRRETANGKANGKARGKTDSRAGNAGIAAVTESLAAVIETRRIMPGTTPRGRTRGRGTTPRRNKPPRPGRAY